MVTWVSNSKSQSKHDLAHLLIDLGVTQLTTVGINPRIITAERFATIELRSARVAPSKDDLLAAVQKFLDEHPDHNRTVVEQ